MKTFKLALHEYETTSKTVGYVAKMLMEYFSKEDAKIIAATEITRYYANKDMKEAMGIYHELSKNPSFHMNKIWQTANDNFRCPVCKGLHGVSVPLIENFPGGIFQPPACPGCRCDLTFHHYFK
jgi:hypothetical protein